MNRGFFTFFNKKVIYKSINGSESDPLTQRKGSFMKKLLLALVILSSAQFAHANMSVQEIKAILETDRVKKAIGKTQITNIRNDGPKLYTIAYGECALQTKVVVICPPGLAPEGENMECLLEAQFQDSDVDCI